jgi:hypothetical protein
MTKSLRPYNTKELKDWTIKLDNLGDDVSRRSACMIKMLIRREAELLYQLKGYDINKHI